MAARRQRLRIVGPGGPPAGAHSGELNAARASEQDRGHDGGRHVVPDGSSRRDDGEAVMTRAVRQARVVGHDRTERTG